MSLSPLLLTILGGCEQPKAWQGWAYPNAFDLTDDIPLGSFPSLEACRASAKAVIGRTEERRDENGDPITGDYECGFKCELDGGPGGLNVCEKTSK